MTGFAIVEQLRIGQRMRKRRWRESAFLHQLSPNGSLLINKNHDPIWEHALWKITGKPQIGWTTNSRILRVLPAGLVRQMLWYSSYHWWSAMMTYRQELALFALERGLIELDDINTLDRRLETVAQQLQDLAWCAIDQDQGRIKTVTKK